MFRLPFFSRKKHPPEDPPQPAAGKPLEFHPLSVKLEDNRRDLERVFDRVDDFILRPFTIAASPPIPALLVFLDGLVDKALVNPNILEPLMIHAARLPQGSELRPKSAITEIQERLVTMCNGRQVSDLVEVTNAVLGGDLVVLVDGCSTALVVSARGWETRQVAEPETETVIRGSRDGFVETLRINTSLIRRRLKTSRLKMEKLQVGLLTKTDVAVLYLDDYVMPGLVDEVKSRLSRINVDAILGSGHLEEYIEDNPFSPFPQMGVTERPDKVSFALLEGQVAVVVDNTPFVLIMPITFHQFLQSPEDYENCYIPASIIRLIRYMALNIALLLPSLYIAIVTYHHEMLPTPLLRSIAAAREGVPFPAFVEAMLMEAVFEILREAGVRLPRPVGQAVSIVGALVIGEAAVSAGLVSPAMVIVVALTAIASFVVPSVSGSLSIRMLRFPIMFAAAALGLFGIMMVLMMLLFHLCSLRSFGIPYLSPFAPLSFRDLKDSFIRLPHWALFTRPRLTGYREPARQDYRQKPHLPLKPRRKGDGDA